jgi:hypothetical protein
MTDMMIVKLGYKSFVMDNEAAFSLATIMSKADRYEEKYYSAKRDDKGSVIEESRNTYHVWAPEPTEVDIEMRLINDDFAKMAKLAGKPAND